MSSMIFFHPSSVSGGRSDPSHLSHSRLRGHTGLDLSSDANKVCKVETLAGAGSDEGDAKLRSLVH